MVRGDTASFLVDITPYEISDGDKLIFKVKDLFEKETDPDQPVNILPEDTEEAEAGIYLYDAELRTISGEVYTVLGPSIFILIGDVKDATTDNGD